MIVDFTNKYVAEEFCNHPKQMVGPFYASENVMVICDVCKYEVSTFQRIISTIRISIDDLHITCSRLGTDIWRKRQHKRYESTHTYVKHLNYPLCGNSVDLSDLDMILRKRLILL